MARSKSAGSVTILSGASLSGPINLGSKVLVAIIMPAAWTAAAISFQASEDNGTTWYDVFDSAGTEVSIVSAGAAAGRRVSIDPTPFAGIDCIRLRSGLTAAAVTQGADRVLTLVSRKSYALS